MKTRHYETRAFVPSPADRVFGHIDEHTRLSSHMSKSSWMIGGGRMTIGLDAAQGKSVGSCIRLSGRILGMDLGAEKVVTERSPPLHKVWETTGVPKLLVIGHYRMGFDLTSQGTGSIVRVFIDYVLPEKIPARWLGNLFGKYYAKWCTRQMVDDAVKHFASIS